ncbi:MAG: hypothetical protein JKY94_01765 [Rhodobacteraceae bacterium]|nr:hypothetical protein [Paracoccaceae bacterium]
MADDIKSLTKKCVDLEKRLKFAEAKIKVVADAMTSAKDIDKFLDVLQDKMEKDFKKGIETSEKTLNREFEMSQKSTDTYNKEKEREYQKQRKEDEKFNKEMEKMSNDSVRQAEFSMIMARLANLEAQVAGLRR